jgi:hypothetical protein
MKTAWGTALAISCALTATIFAQTQPPASSSTQDRTVTVVGCLAAADKPSGTATSGTTGTGTPPSTSASAAESFILKNAKPSPPSPATGTTGTATPPSTSASATGTTYKLSGSAAELKPHLGHQIEITGTIPSASSATGTGTTPPATPPSSGSSANQPELRVRSVKMVSSTCPME